MHHTSFWLSFTLLNNSPFFTLLPSLSFSGQNRFIKLAVSIIICFGIILFRNGSYKIRNEGARNALNEILSGANASKIALLAAVSRLATNAEKLFATDATGPGGGNGGTARTSANTNFVGALTHNQIGAALNS